jgi:radical SAM protein (TIGR01212 family)
LREVSALGDVVGVVFGTRPDCISKALLRIWKEFHQQSFVSVEIGAQSFFNSQLEFLKRGHTASQTIDAIKLLNQESGINIGVHLIFGVPGETEQHIIETASLISELPVDNVKLHNLHVLKGTGLEKLYRQGDFIPLNLGDYADRVILFLQHLPPRIAVHRLAAIAPQWDELVAPEWCRSKNGTRNFILNRMRENNAFQGQCLR